jgi:lipopolysaccharide biosynthesis glycosyltransferase
MRTDKIQVAFCADPGYIKYLGVALYSLYLHNHAADVDVHLCISGLTDEDAGKLQVIEETFSTRFHYVSFDLERLKPLKTYLQSSASFYRLMLPELLPDIDKLIYLDCDLVVQTRLDALWDQDLKGQAVVAFPEPDYHQKWLVPRYQLQDDLYVNAGVLVMHLAYWRAHHITQACLTWLTDNQNLATMMDQDAINVVLRGKKTWLDRKWNLNPVHGPVAELLQIYPERILHFAGPHKPWHKCYHFGLQAIYAQYVNLSPWRDAIGLQEPTTQGAAYSVANQLRSAGREQEAGRYFQLAITLRLQSIKLESLLLLDLINTAHWLYNTEQHLLATKLYDMVFRHWGFRNDSDDICAIPHIG